MKLCKDCKHYIEGSAENFDRCAKRYLAGSETLHLVRGNAPRYGFCEETRSDIPNRCGPEGRWFEAKDAA